MAAKDAASRTVVTSHADARNAEADISSTAKTNLNMLDPGGWHPCCGKPALMEQPLEDARKSDSRGLARKVSKAESAAT